MQSQMRRRSRQQRAIQGSLNVGLLSSWVLLGLALLASVLGVRLEHCTMTMIVGPWFGHASGMVPFLGFVLGAMIWFRFEGHCSMYAWLEPWVWLTLALSFNDVSSSTKMLAGILLPSTSQGEYFGDLSILYRSSMISLLSSWLMMLSCAACTLLSLRRVQSLHRRISLAYLVPMIPAVQWMLYKVIESVPWPDCTLSVLGGVCAMLGSLFLLPRRQLIFFLVAYIAVSAKMYANFKQCMYCGDIQSSHRTSFTALSAIWTCPLQHGGRLEVREGVPKVASEERAKVQTLNIGHSVIGGMWIQPPDIRHIPIYSAFHLQSAAALFLSPDVEDSVKQQRTKRSLHIGLGIGTSVQVLQKLGFVTDIMEIHPEVLDAAKTFFNLSVNGQTFLGDAGSKVQELERASYDIIISDLFSGDVDISLMESRGFYEDIQRILKPNGIAVVNFFGLFELQLWKVHHHMNSVFEHVRCFRDDNSNDIIANYVLFASNSEEFRQKHLGDAFNAGSAHTAFHNFSEDIELALYREIEFGQIIRHAAVSPYGMHDMYRKTRTQMRSAGQHIRLLHTIF